MMVNSAQPGEGGGSGGGGGGVHALPLPFTLSIITSTVGVYAQFTEQNHSSYFSSTLVSSVISIILLHYKALTQFCPVFFGLENLVFGKFVEKCPNCFSGQTCRGRQEASTTPSPRSTRPPSTSFSRATPPSANRCSSRSSSRSSRSSLSTRRRPTGRRPAPAGRPPEQCSAASNTSSRRLYSSSSSSRCSARQRLAGQTCRLGPTSKR
jgi:hypothetical protein